MPVAVGEITAPTGGGTPQDQSVSSLTFTPKAVIFFTTRSTAAGTTAAAIQCVGWATNSTDQRSWGWSGDDNVSPSNLARFYTTECLRIVSDGTPTLDAIFNFKQFNSDGFTITWTDLPAVAAKIGYIAIGGVGVQVSVDEHTMQSGTGNKSYSGVGFQPELVFFGTTQQTSTGTSTSNLWSFGAAKSSTERFCHCVAGNDGQTMSSSVNCGRTHSNTRCIIGVGTNSTINLAADFVSMDTDGFTINQITNPGLILFTTLSIKGFTNLELGAFTKPTTGGGTNQPTTAFTPEGYIFFAADNTAVQYNQFLGDAEAVIGFTDRTNQVSCWAGARDVVNTDCNKVYSSTRTYVSASTTNPTGTETEASISGTTFTWNPNTSESNIVFYASFILPDRINPKEIAKLKDGAPASSKQTNLTVYELAKISEPAFQKNISYSNVVSELVKLIETKTVDFSGTGGTSFTRPQNEIVLLKEQVNKFLVANRILSEIVKLKEGTPIARSSYLLEEFEIVKLYEKITKGKAIQANDLVKLKELNLRAFAKNLAELVKLAETTPPRANFTIYKIDTTLLRESVQNLVSKLANEKILLKEQFSKTAVFIKAINEIVKLIENRTRTYTGYISKTEIVKLIEDSLRRYFAISVNELIDVSEFTQLVVSKNTLKEIVKLAELISLTTTGAGQNYSRTQNEIVKLVESANKLASYLRSINEKVVLKEATSKQIHKSILEVVKLAETMAAIGAFTKNNKEVVVLSEKISKLATKIAMEVVLLKEAKSFAKTKNLTEIVKLVEAKSFAKTKNLSEIVKLIEAKSFGKTKNLNEIVKLIETKSFAKTKNINEIVKLRDTTLKNIAKLSSDIVKLSDTFSKQTAYSKGVFEVVKLKEYKLLAIVDYRNDKTLLIDTATVSAKFNKSATEVVTLKDLLFKGVTKLVADRILLNELLRLQLVYNKSINDKVLLYELFSINGATSIAYNRTASEIAKLVESFRIAGNFNRVFTERELLSENKQLLVARGKTDIVKIDDEVTKHFAKMVKESILFKESTIKNIATNKVNVDLIKLKEAFAYLAARSKTFSDRALLVELFTLVQKTVHYSKSVLDTVELIENFFRSFIYKKTVTDRVLLDENFAAIFSAGSTVSAFSDRIITKDILTSLIVDVAVKILTATLEEFGAITATIAEF